MKLTISDDLKLPLEAVTQTFLFDANVSTHKMLGWKPKNVLDASKQNQRLHFQRGVQQAAQSFIINVSRAKGTESAKDTSATKTGLMPETKNGFQKIQS